MQCNTYTKMNLSTRKWAQWDKIQSRELLGLFICVCIALCTIVAHSIAQNRPDNFPSYPPDNRHCSDDVYLREGGLHAITLSSNTVFLFKTIIYMTITLQQCCHLATLWLLKLSDDGYWLVSLMALSTRLIKLWLLTRKAVLVNIKESVSEQLPIVPLDT